MKLLSRDEFRRLTLKRNGGICVVPECLKPAVDAHHILNRNLFIEEGEEGGYFYENGSGLCSLHHLQAEQTLISTIDLYAWCQIDDPAVPSLLESGTEYDTWGNEVRADGTRIPGVLFNDEGCQKALRSAGLLWKFWA